MKKIMLGLMLSCLASSVMAIDQADLDNRIRALTDKFEAFQHRADNGIPPEILRKAQGIVLLDTSKGGLIVGFQGGDGVAMVKDAKLKKWSPVAFFKMNKGSFGLQIGGEQTFYVILLMTTNSTWRLVDPKVEFAAGAGGTANNNTDGVESKTPSDQDVLVYTDRNGLYSGAVVKVGGISPDNDANHDYYAQDLSPKDILFDHKARPTAPASDLAGKIHSYAHKKAEPSH